MKSSEEIRGGETMKITEPIVIRKLRTKGYEATGRLEGHGIIRRRAQSVEKAKERFFEACNVIGLKRGRGLGGFQVRA